MRTAYRGRSAARELQGDLDGAVTDLNLALLLYAAELEILDEQTSPDRGKLMREAAQVYRQRGKLRARQGKNEAAQADDRRARELDANAAKLAVRKDVVTSAADLARQIEELRKNVDRTLAELARLEEKRRENFGPGDDPGRIEVTNAWTNPVTVVVDGVGYIVQPGETRTVTRAAGDFTFEVRDVKTPATRSLKPGQTYRIRINPR